MQSSLGYFLRTVVTALRQSPRGAIMNFHLATNNLGWAATAHWQDEWKSLAEETRDMVHETFEILMDQVRHLDPVIDYSMISLDTRWNPKAKRIYNPKAEAQEQSEPVAEERSDPAAGVPLGEDVRKFRW
ncbi:hypothetical protein PIB30_068056 [Stylosanthes scabra]|uniref:Uncharacterized protein n=1 Tax=Stylosanthes scabra TaxID=79078 RepID=A0ABU6SMU9_9FABA|nr:hypothetical protein [Stylosanthes scabra]